MRSLSNQEDAEDILHDALAFLGGEPVIDNDTVSYGEIVLTVAAKAGKANTLLADHLFSPSLLLAERIERGLVALSRCPHTECISLPAVLELGAGCALPSLLSATLLDPPSLVLATDYPDAGILANLEANVQRNTPLVAPGCVLAARGYEWGTDVTPLLELAPGGFDVLILSDLLHFHTSHGALLASISSLLSRTPTARAYVAAGTYTHVNVCADFVRDAGAAGLVLEEGTVEDAWLGTLAVGGLDPEGLAVRKRMCRWWVGRWADSA
ncbi:hypothetical protein PLICRDRAFT_42330 [Plicaturopsis crispa FD-325 SS-3]|nr:hypothetical protein PLICRDRAFT_42330 [Plicaturopsis crispa FD-325 SS-3]